MFETLDRVKGALPAGTTLLGFCGAPWTVASYMIAGKGTPDQAPARLLAYRDPGFMLSLVDRLAAASVAYLTAQIDAGAEAVQIFESFGAALPPALFGPLSLDPIRQIVQGLKAARPQARVIVFVRGGGGEPCARGRGRLCRRDRARLDVRAGAAPAGASGGARDAGQPRSAGARRRRRSAPARRRRDLRAARGRPHIFNLGHGIVPETPIDHVEARCSGADAETFALS